MSRFTARLPLLSRVASSAATLAFAAACQFAWFVLLARALGVDAYGELLLITAVTTFGGVLCGLGGGDALIRRTAQARGDFPRLLGHGLILVGVSGAALTALSAAALDLLLGGRADAPPVGVLLLFSLANIALFRFVGFVEQTFIARGEFARANGVNALFALVRVGAAGVACLVFRIGSLAEWAVWNAGAHLLAALLCAAALLRLERPVWAVDRRELGLGFHFCTPRVVEALRGNIDRLLLGAIAPPVVLGSYGTASQMARTSQILVTAMNRIAYPRLARAAWTGPAAMLRVAKLYTVAVVALALLTAAGVFLIAPAMPLLLGADYQAVVGALQILCWMTVPLSLQTVPYDLLGALEQHALRARVYNAITLVGTGVTAALVLAFGIAGAFVAAYAVQIALTVGLWLVFWRGRKTLQRPKPAQAATVAAQ